ncbi:MAG: hypothetical protein K2Q09_07400 [Phycisphaerales bacterium]|nr:hypothetical protein [Phycisphaerales bacterium]
MKQAQISQAVRAFLPELAIGSACCAAGYFFFVDPLVKKAAAAHAEVDALTLAITHAGAKPPAADPDRAEAARRALDAVSRRSAVATDQPRLLQAVSTLADQCGVRIEQFNPALPRGPRPAPGQSGMAAKTDKKVEQRSAFSICFTATYANAGRFIRSLQQDIGFTAVRSLRIAPISPTDTDTVSVVIDTEHVAVNPANIPASCPMPAPQTQQSAAVPEHRP